MDFDLSKENIQPLRGGRNVTQLGVALQAQTSREYQRELQQQKQEFENAIRCYEGDDPLDNWYHYISWIEQSYPKHGHEGNLLPLLEHCLEKYENDKRYSNDRRFCKLWIKYNDLQTNPLELYQMMYSRGLCRGCADFYRGWAYYYEAAEDFHNANLIFQYGKKELAQPYDELEMAHNNMFMAAGQHVLIGKDEKRLHEKRMALTSLHTYRPGRVGSVRTASGGAGVIASATNIGHSSKSNIAIPIFEDLTEGLRGAGAPPISILSVARRHEAPKENTMKPGPWTTVPVKKRMTTGPKVPTFSVHEDCEDINMSGGIRLPENYPRTTMEDYSNWNVNLIIPEPFDSSVRPMYPKAKVYSQPPMEFSIEEVRARRYSHLLRNNCSSSLEHQHGTNKDELQHVEAHMIDQNIVFQQPVENHLQHYSPLQHQQQQHRINTNTMFPFTEQSQLQQDPHFHFQHNMSNQMPNMDHQIPNMSNQMSNMSNQIPNMSNQMPNMSNQMPNMSNQMSNMSNQMPNLSNQMPNLSNQMPNMSNQMPNMSNQMPNMSSQMSNISNQVLHTPSRGEMFQQHSMVNSSMEQHHPQVEFVQQQQPQACQSPIYVYCDPAESKSPQQQQQQMSWHQEQPATVTPPPFQSPARPSTQNSNLFNVWTSDTPEMAEVSITVKPKNDISKFTIYEQSTACIQDQQPKGSAMKTPFKVLTADDLAETGSRGGMDIAAAAQPNDSARRRIPPPDESSGSSLEEMEDDRIPVLSDMNPLNASCDTQMFNFNLNQMKVSTPQHKQQMGQLQQQSVKPQNGPNTKKQLFATEVETVQEPEKALSTILEETKSYGSSSSSDAATKSSIFNSHTKHVNMGTISEEHNSYLAQNLMANAALRSSLLGDLMDFDTHQPQQQPEQPQQPMQSSPVPSAPASPVRTIPPPTPSKPLQHVPSDPFKTQLIKLLLDRVNFPGVHTFGYLTLLSLPKLRVSKEIYRIGSDSYLVERQLGKGTYGTVFKAQDWNSRQAVALKYQKPANRWEFYICRELQARLVNHPLLDRFMDVPLGYFSDQASVLVSNFMPCGSLLDLVNTVKQKSGKTLKESLCIYFCLEMLRIIEAMHQVQIIHADIKPDNFLIQLNPDNVTLQLIDFGCSIDMSLFPPGAMFTKRINTEDFICCEIRDGKPWSYHTDLFCIAATAHVLLFDKYIQLQKKEGHWSITHRLPRYVRMDLWNMFFSSLLNQGSGPADSRPLQKMLEDALSNQDDLLAEMRFIMNILKNR